MKINVNNQAPRVASATSAPAVNIAQANQQQIQRNGWQAMAEDGRGQGGIPPNDPGYPGDPGQTRGQDNDEDNSIEKPGPKDPDGVFRKRGPDHDHPSRRKGPLNTPGEGVKKEGIEKSDQFGGRGISVA